MPLGMENGNIPDDNITASSTYGVKQQAYFARLNNQRSKGSIGAWSPTNKGRSFLNI